MVSKGSRNRRLQDIEAGAITGPSAHMNQLISIPIKVSWFGFWTSRFCEIDINIERFRGGFFGYVTHCLVHQLVNFGYHECKLSCFGQGFRSESGAPFRFAGDRQANV